MDDSLSTIGQIENLKSEKPLFDLLYELPLGGRAIFNEVYELTNDTVIHLADTLNWGWVGGIIVGSFLVRYS